MVMGPDTIRTHDHVWSIGVIGSTVPSTDLDRCLNLVHRDAGCRRCADACPVDAISLEHPAPILDPEACVACGVCVAVCPTDVFGPDDRTEQTLLRSVALAEPADLGVVCVRRDDPTAAPLDVTSVVTHLRCLGSLDTADLLALSADGRRPVWLDDSLCDDCPIGAVHGVITRTTAEANSLLGSAHHIRLASAADATSSVREIIDCEHPRFTRRAFFRSLRDATTDLAEDGDDGIIPHSRRRLLKVLPEIESIEAVEAPFADVTIDADRCTACGSCSRFCPTDALLQTDDKTTFSITFLPSVCLDCGICAVACPEDAISFGTLVERPTDRRVLVTGSLVACESCGTPTAAGPHDGRVLCTWCRQGAGIVKPLVDEAGLFDDLLGRIDE